MQAFYSCLAVHSHKFDAHLVASADHKLYQDLLNFPSSNRSGMLKPLQMRSPQSMFPPPLVLTECLNNCLAAYYVCMIALYSLFIGFLLE